MSLRKIEHADGHYLQGNKVVVDQEIEFLVTTFPEIDTQGGPFIWVPKSGEVNGWQMRDNTKGQPIITVNTDADIVTIHSPYVLEAQGNVIKSAILTTGAATTELGKIETLTDDAIHLIEVKVTAKSDTNSEWAIWSVVLSVTKFSGIPVIRQVDVLSHESSAGLNVNSLSFAVNAGDVDINVTGIAATNIQWNGQYEIVTKST